MSAPNFQSILNKPATAVERPKPLPVGTYLGMIMGLPEFNKVGQKETDVADFQIRILQPQPDVDLVAFAEAKGNRDELKQRARFFITDDALFRLKEFLEHLGIDPAGKSLSEMINEAPGKQVMVSLKHRPSQDGTQIYAEIDRTAAV